MHSPNPRGCRRGIAHGCPNLPVPYRSRCTPPKRGAETSSGASREYWGHRPMIQLVLFDIDGTLIQTGGAGERAFGKVCETEFQAPNGTAQVRFAGRTDTAIVLELFRNHRIEPSPENVRRFFESYVFWLDHMLDQTEGRVLPGIARWMEDLAGLPRPPAIGLLTGNIRLGAQIKLSHYRLWNHFATGAFGDDHEDRNQVAQVARRRGSRHLGRELRGEEILVVGDTPMDIACARAIGARVLAVATGSYALKELETHRPDWTVNNLEQIRAGDFCR
jgi:phosphoglycolate phosphatase